MTIGQNGDCPATIPWWRRTMRPRARLWLRTWGLAASRRLRPRQFLPSEAGSPSPLPETTKSPPLEGLSDELLECEDGEILFAQCGGNAIRLNCDTRLKFQCQ